MHTVRAGLACRSYGIIAFLLPALSIASVDPALSAVTRRVAEPVATTPSRTALPVVPTVKPQAVGSLCGPDGVQPSGDAIYRICMPDGMAWNGDLVIWAHGYVEAGRRLEIPEEQLCLGGTFCLPAVTNALGFGFITTSYSMNGLVTTGVSDVLELVEIFTREQGAPENVYLVGASEGGLITTLAVEQHPEVFDGGLAACGPIGDFHRQVSYYGHFRVLFDYYFPGLLTGSPLAIPDDLIADWESIWNDQIKPVVFDPANAQTLMQLLRVTRSSYVMNDPASIELTVHDALWYNVFATNDIILKLGGPPFDNMSKVYMGSTDDAALNAAVARYAADPVAIAAIDAGLQTSGVLSAPLVTLHTTMDQQVAFMHEFTYGMKLRDSGSMAQRVLIPAFRYGHCNFKPWEALLSFAVLISRVMGQAPVGAEALLPDDGSRQAYLEGAARAGILPAN